MKKIFLCIPTLAAAGAEKFVTDLACNIDKSQFDVTVITTNRWTTDTSFYKRLTSEGISIIDVSADNYWKEFCNIRSAIKKHRPEIVHTNIGAAFHMLLPVWLEGKKITHYYTVHSIANYDLGGLKKKIMKIALKRKKIIAVAIGDTVKKTVCDEYGISTEQVPCIYNGVDTSAFMPKEKYCEDDVCRFISVGSLIEIKNHKMIIDAFNMVRKKYDNVKLTIVGDGVLFDSLKQQVVDLGLENDVELTGNRSDVGALLAESDVYCSASTIEGLPISILEAMSTGLPIIATPAGGVVDIVRDDVNGYIVPHGDLEAMADRMMLFARDKTAVETIGRASRTEALKYDEKLCAKGYEELYNSSKNREN